GLLARVGDTHDLHMPGLEDEECIPGIALMEQHLARTERPATGDLCQGSKLFLGERGKVRYPCHQREGRHGSPFAGSYATQSAMALLVIRPNAPPQGV